jgi:Tfp pilus assembly protein PilF
MHSDRPIRRIPAARHVLALALVSFALLSVPPVATRAAEGSSPANGPVAAPAPGVPEALAKVQAGDPAAAIAILKEVTAREPGNARAWRVLGFASLKAKEPQGAVAAYQRSLELEPGFPAAMYNLAVGYALAGDRDNAFAWLAKTAATKKLDMTQIEADADLVSLKDDARFRALLPTPDDFAHPFVDPAVILKEWDGEAMNDQFGWIARNVGDVDGDGANDVVTSAPTRAIDGKPAGRIYVYSSRSGRLLWSADGRPDDQLGTGVEGAGDTNHDGVPDVVAGAPGGGRALVYAGRDGKVLLTLEAENKDDSFGRHASGPATWTATGTPTSSSAPPATTPAARTPAAPTSIPARPAARS